MSWQDTKETPTSNLETDSQQDPHADRAYASRGALTTKTYALQKDASDGKLAEQKVSRRRMSASGKKQKRCGLDQELT